MGNIVTTVLSPFVSCDAAARAGERCINDFNRNQKKLIYSMDKVVNKAQGNLRSLKRATDAGTAMIDTMHGDMHSILSNVDSITGTLRDSATASAEAIMFSRNYVNEWAETQWQQLEGMVAEKEVFGEFVVQVMGVPANSPQYSSMIQAYAAVDQRTYVAVKSSRDDLITHLYLLQPISVQNMDLQEFVNTLYAYRQTYLEAEQLDQFVFANLISIYPNLGELRNRLEAKEASDSTQSFFGDSAVHLQAVLCGRYAESAKVVETVIRLFKITKIRLSNRKPVQLLVLQTLWALLLGAQRNTHVAGFCTTPNFEQKLKFNLELILNRISDIEAENITPSQPKTLGYVAGGRMALFNFCRQIEALLPANSRQATLWKLFVNCNSLKPTLLDSRRTA